MTSPDPDDKRPGRPRVESLQSEDPLRGEPRRVEGIGAFRMTGTGQVTLDLKGKGRLVVKRGRNDSFSFEGDGVPRHTSSDQILVANAEGQVVVSGETIQLEFSGGLTDLALLGVFELERSRPKLEEPTEAARPGERPASRIRSRYFDAS